MPSPRIACLLIPEWPLQAEWRAHPELRGQALAVASGPDSKAEIIALSSQARAAGVLHGQLIARARTTCPNLEVRVASPALEQSAREALQDVALSCSPRVALAPRVGGLFASEASIFLDASGVESVFHSESGFASVLAERARQQGLHGVVALASSRTVSRLVARSLMHQTGTTQILLPEQESAFLDPLPLDLLDLDDRTSPALTRFGIRTVKDLRALPRRGLAQRLGPDLLSLLDRTNGKNVEPPLPEPREDRIEERMDLESPIQTLEPLGFILNGMISRITQRLSLRALACQKLEINLLIEDGGRESRQITTAAPTRDGRVLLRLASLDLERSPPSAPVESLSIQTRGVPTPTNQLDLFAPPSPDPQALDQTLAELGSLCGEDRVGAPRLLDTHHPTAFSQKPFQPIPHENIRQKRNPALPRTPTKSTPTLRMIRPPVRAEIRIHQGHPCAIRSAITSGEVIVCSGPWRTTGHWWSPDERFAFDHFDIQVDDGCVIRLCFDWVQRIWQIDGLYD